MSVPLRWTTHGTGALIQRTPPNSAIALISKQKKCRCHRLTFFAKSRWLFAIATHLSLKPTTFCLWNRSRSACMAVHEYLRSAADEWSASSRCGRDICGQLTAAMTTRVRRTPLHLSDRLSRLGDSVPPRRLRVDVHHPVKRKTQRVEESHPRCSRSASDGVRTRMGR